MNQTLTGAAAWLAPWFAILVVSVGIVFAMSVLVFSAQVSPVQAETTLQCSSNDDPMLTYARTTQRVPEHLGDTCFGN
jgi:hypothetical protein